MTISGFTMVRNADKFYFPIKQSILSILPIVDEFIIALGDCEESDKTEEIIHSINSPKIKIFHRKWDEAAMVDGKIYADETNFALSKCKGDWCFYLQADECIHEQDHDKIVEACAQNLSRSEVDGLLFDYRHFWGDYDHYLPFRGWYRNEIRLFKNHRDIYSFKDAQSFRRKSESNPSTKLNVVHCDVKVYHYGWVRPPEIMQSKKKEQDVVHYKTKDSEEIKESVYDYGVLRNIPQFTETHPAVMKAWMSKIHWKHTLNYDTITTVERPLFKHEKLKYRLISWVENKIFGGKTIFGYKNWKKVK